MLALASRERPMGSPYPLIAKEVPADWCVSAVWRTLQVAVSTVVGLSGGTFMIVLYQDERGHRYKTSIRQAMWTDEKCAQCKHDAPYPKTRLTFTASLITASSFLAERGVHACLGRAPCAWVCFAYHVAPAGVPSGAHA